MKTKKENLKINFIILIFAVIFLIIIYKVFYIVTVYDNEGENKFVEYTTLTEPDKKHYPKTYLQKEKSPVNLYRGTIYDRHFEKLAFTLEIDNLMVYLNKIDNIDRIAVELSKIFELNYHDIRNKLKGNKKNIAVIEDISADQERQIKILLKDDFKSKNIQIHKAYKRVYPYGKLASHVLGFASKDNKGLNGVELQFDNILSGKKLRNEIFRSPIGLVFSGKKILTSLLGSNVVLTIDRYIQGIVETEMDRAFKEYNPVTMTVIILKAGTGEILAMANKPDYDPNAYGKATPFMWKNHAITDWMEPGSTLKIVTALILLKERKKTLEQKFRCTGKVERYGNTIHCYRNISHGIVNLESIIQHSCNVGMVQAIDPLEKNIYYHNLRLFGFGIKPGVDLPGENAGLLKKPDDWSKLTKYEVAIGQEIAVTPLQLINSLSVLSNGGLLLRPTIIKEIRDYNNRIIEKDDQPKIIRRVVDSDKTKIITDFMVKVVDAGSGRRAKINGIKIAGKTGTAQKVDKIKGGYSDKNVVSSFFGFLPAYKPEISMLVVVNDPDPPGPGGLIAAPIFKNIAEKILEYLEIYPVSNVYRKKNNPVEKQKVTAEYTEVKIDKKNNEMPSLIGMSLREAYAVLNSLDLKVKSSGSGYVIKQSIEKGEPIKRGGEVFLVLSPGP